MRTLAATLACISAFTPLGATTLEQLSLNDMIVKSTAIVHAKVTGSYSALRGVDVYTYYQLQVSEILKSSSQTGQSIEVAVPGGATPSIRQRVPGAPAIALGGDYVLFLWTSRSGLTQVIGLSQGLFRMTQDSAGNAIIVRPASTEPMVDKNGVAVTDQLMTFRWSDVRSQIRAAQGTGN